MLRAPFRSAFLVATGLLIAVGTTITPHATSAARADPDLVTIPVGSGAGMPAFSPDGSLGYISGYDSGTVTVFDTATDAVRATIPVPAHPRGIAFSHDGSLAYVASESGPSGKLTEIDVALSQVKRSITLNATAFDVAISPDGDTAWVAGSDGTQIVDHLRATPTVSSLRGGLATFVQFSADGSSVYLAINDGIVRYDASTRKVTATGGPGGTSRLVFSPDGSRALFTTGNARISVQDLTFTTMLQEIPTDHYGTVSVDLSPSGSEIYAVTQSDDQLLTLDYGSGTILRTTTLPATPQSVTTSPDGSKLYVVTTTPTTLLVVPVNRPAPAEPEVDRISGTDRYDVAVKVSQAGFPTTAPVVYVATGEKFADALSAAPAAVKQGGPVLLTPTAALPKAVEDEIRRLEPSTIVTVGGVNSVSPAVRTALASIAPVVPIEGADRYAVSRAVARYAFGTADGIYVAAGENFPDALSASAAAGSRGYPVILIPGQGDPNNPDAFDADTKALFNELDPSRAIVVGGPNTIRNPVMFAFTNAIWGPQPEITRLWGNDRFSASQNINGEAFISASSLYLATGFTFPDALAGAAVAGAQHAPLYVVPGTCVPQRVLDDITSRGVQQVTLLGGTASLTPAVESLTAC
ncbi:cell wall-binding repeat-containing protein [Herbiconiux sp. UC225_62]|uniref:cell wall-binding repeat-containing protein n=1 Tax=Herbiconiux sp. UC225_62 TaxID=3350168 RepID=UPI0036D213E6